MAQFTLDVEVERLLGEGKAAARTGDNALARQMLTQVVERDPNNEQAWMWLSGVVAESEEQQICLENVLVINPRNTKARKGLEYISAKTGIAPSIPPMPTGILTPPATELTTPLSADSLPYTEGSAPAMAQTQLPWITPAGGDGFSPMPGDVPPSSILPWLQGDEPGKPLSVAASPDATVSPFGAPLVEGPDPALFAPPVELDDAPAPYLEQTTSGSALPDYLDFKARPGDAEPLPTWDDAQQSAPIPLHQFDLGGEAWSHGGGAAPYEAQMPDGGDSPDDTSFAGVNGSYARAEGDMPFGIQPYAEDAGDNGASQWAQEQAVSAPGGSQEWGMGNPSNSRNGSSNGASRPDPFSLMEPSEVGPMGPYSNSQLPAPNELPGFDGSGAEAQPWYLQSSTNLGSVPSGPPADGSALYSGGLTQMDLSGQSARTVVIIPCPNCKADVPDSALACPNCRYTFFVNCPNCHELVDTSEAKPGKVEPCPHCRVELKLLDLGLTGVEGALPYTSETLKGTAQPSSIQGFAIPEPPRKSLSFGWLVDILWLLVIVMTVWALTQLPTWLHLTGQY